MPMMRVRVRGHRWVDHPAAAVMKARVPGQWVDCPAAVVMEAREQGRCWIDHPAVAVMEARVQGRHWVDRPSVGEFYYIQMEKFARQAATEGHTQTETLTLERGSELFRQLNLHYNRNNQIEAPESFRLMSETTMKEFFQAINAKRDVDSSWKKSIYKVIARLDEPVPEFLKAPNWMDHLGEACMT
ncbi:hypothetical protein ACOMHN_050885 [Nucella lapillus]